MITRSEAIKLSKALRMDGLTFKFMSGGRDEDTRIEITSRYSFISSSYNLTKMTPGGFLKKLVKTGAELIARDAIDNAVYGRTLAFGAHTDDSAKRKFFRAVAKELPLL